MKLTKFLIVLLLLLFPFGQLTRIPLGISGVALYFQDLIVAGLFFWWIIDHLLKRKPFFKPPLALPIIGFILIAVFSLLINFSRLNLSEFFVSFLYLLRWSAYAGIYFVTYEISRESRHATHSVGVVDPRHKMSGQKNMKTEKNRIEILNLLIWAGITTAVFGLIQYFLYPNLRNLYYLGWDPHQYRIFGTFLDPGFLGIILVLTLILLLCFKTLKQGIRLSGILIVFLTLLLTYSRSSYLALTMAMIVLTWLKRSLKFLLIPVLILFFAVGISILPRQPSEGVKLERTSTISARLENYQQSLKIIKDNLFFGAGFNSLRFVKRDYDLLNQDWQESHSGAGIDSSLLFVLATTGVVGLSVYLWMFWKIIQLALSHHPRSQSPPRRKDTLRLLSEASFSTIAIISALFVHSFFLNSLFYPWVMLWMWVLLGFSHSENK
ncbi:O-antigen ligase family protein [Candidatus Microgenomates bacterium]|nr:O-antigen ligase family protein [Candidatus Microgenomates bacterium]